MPEAKAEIWDMNANVKLGIFSGVGPAMKSLVGSRNNITGVSIIQFTPDGEVIEFSGDTLTEMLNEYAARTEKAGF